MPGLKSWKIVALSWTGHFFGHTLDKECDQKMKQKTMFGHRHNWGFPHSAKATVGAVGGR
jgi:hypothetical protein